MRFLWAGFLLLLLISSDVAAQATGSVQQLGFSGNYRADCWTPLLVHLESTLSTTAEYQIQVSQQDLDQDTVVFTRTVTLGPAGPAGRGDFWVYFLPQPTNSGLRGPNNAASLADVLKVHLFDKKGKTHIAALPIAPEAMSVQDLEQNGVGGAMEMSPKVVLVVYGDATDPHETEYPGLVGVTEQTHFIRVSPRLLPDHMIGYQAVDAVLWINGDWSRIQGTPQFGALQQWVKHGGQLAVCQPSDRTQLEPLADADMLPVIAKSGAGGAGSAWLIQIREKKDVLHLAEIVKMNAPGFNKGEGSRAWDAMSKAGRKFEVAYAQPRKDAMVDAWVVWPAEGEKLEEKTPFIARRAYGTGSVAWVAQNLGAPELTACADPLFPPKPGQQPRPLYTSGWPRIWDRVFGWKNQSHTTVEVKTAYGDTSPDPQYSEGNTIDIAAGYSKEMEHSARSSTYIVIAVLFFIAYWIVAGPGSYLYLAARKKKGLSWTIFGAAALVATVLTIGLVKLVLYGGAVARHVTVVRLVPDAPAADGSPRFAADIFSRIGLYIPKDGYQRVSMPAAGPERVAAIAPYAIPPNWLKKENDAGFTDTARYVVDTDPVLAGQAPVTDFFFRSTLKKIQAQWSGSIAAGITGQAKLSKGNPDAQPIVGVLTNKTGQALSNVYFVFTYGWVDADASGDQDNDRVLFVPSWPAGGNLDIGAEFANSSSLTSDHYPGVGKERIHSTLEPIRGGSFTKYWFDRLPGGVAVEHWTDRDNDYRTSFPLMALLDRVGPSHKSSNESERHNAFRRGFRDMDVSGQVAAGRLVILAHASSSPLPAPLTVNGEPTESSGLTLYEIALPLDREDLKPAPPATTRSTTRSATQPATTRAAIEPAK